MSDNFPYDKGRPIDLIAMGRVGVDLYAEQIAGRLPSVQSFRKYIGGCAGNIAVGTARLGLKSAMLSCVGQDAMGDFVRETLINENVDVSLLQSTTEHLTGLVLLGVSPPEHFPLIFYRENCADLHIEKKDIDVDMIKQAKALLITGTGFSHTNSAEAASHFAVKLAKKAGTAVILDIDYRPVLWGLTAKGEGERRFEKSAKVSAIFEKVLPHVDLLVGTEEEILIAGGKSDVTSSLKRIRELTHAPIVLKRGEKGCEIFTDNVINSIRAKPFPVEVLNVLGAGDGFMSGFLSAWLQGNDWLSCGERGNAAGAIVVSRHSCAPAIPSVSELDYFINHYSKLGHTIFNDAMFNHLHQQVTLGESLRCKPLAILAYDHRHQFVTSCENANKPKQLIAAFKQQIYAGFQLASKQYNIDKAAIIIDPEYGDSVLKKVDQDGVLTGVPIELSGSQTLEWLKPISAYEILHTRPANWFVKVLWQYHPDMDENMRQHQWEKLQELAHTCQKLDRYLMLELIVPSEYDYNGKILAQIIESVYCKRIYPYWWKVAAIGNNIEWKMVTQALDKYDQNTKIVVLGGGQADINTFSPVFNLVKSTAHCGGFAIGRTIFWSIWLQLLNNEIQLTQVPTLIAERYWKVCQLWQQA